VALPALGEPPAPLAVAEALAPGAALPVAALPTLAEALALAAGLKVRARPALGAVLRVEAALAPEEACGPHAAAARQLAPVAATAANLMSRG
jgi:hypothetical protein